MKPVHKAGKRKAKIVCTIGPSSAHKKTIEALVKNGMDVARLNFSHGTHETHRMNIQRIREAAAKAAKPVAVLQDLQGIKIRTGSFEDGCFELKKGRTVNLLPGKKRGNSETIFISYKPLLKDAHRGQKVLLDDGLIQLRVTGRTSKGLYAKITEGGLLRNKMGVNFPGMNLSVSSFTKKDRLDLMFGVAMGVDYIAVSFVREVRDIKKVKNWLRSQNLAIPVIAKIEKPEALTNIHDIMSEIDGIMVARGDLGVEMPVEEIPLIQKELIAEANKCGKIVITATQMLQSMTEHLRPSRAETTDVANAVLDGTDALMLSAETAIGKYPVESLKMMDRIITYTESLDDTEDYSYMSGKTFAEAAAGAACRAAEVIHAKVLAAFTQSGFTAKLLSKYRPRVPIIAFTPTERIRNKASLYWGVTPKVMRLPATTDEMVAAVERSLVADKIVKSGDGIVITSSSPLSTQGKTNFMKLHRIGE
jgi:pyruvate kinase